MRVSVVTPNYNGALTIERTIRSVLNQDYPDVEHIVVDDGSADSSRNIVRRYRAKVMLIEKENGGQPTALNAGFRAATGDLVCWLNSDDLLLPGAIGCAVRALQSESSASMIYGDYVVINESDQVIAVRRQPSYDYSISLYGYLTISNACVFFSRSALMAAGDADEMLPRACDMDLFLRVARQGRVVHVSQFMGAYRERCGSIHLTQGAHVENETWKVRARHAPPHLTRRELEHLHRAYKFKAALRMLREGVIWCRFRPFASRHLPRCQQLVNAALASDPA